MKKLFKILWILEILGALRGHRRHGHHYGDHHHGYGPGLDYRRSRSHYPLYRRRYRHSLVEHALRRLLHGRRYH